MTAQSITISLFQFNQMCKEIEELRVYKKQQQEKIDILNKIKAEIEKESEVKTLQLHWGEAMGLNKALEIIDKYSEVSE